MIDADEVIPAADLSGVHRFDDVREDLALSCDVVVVGSGAGGAVTAAICAEAGLSVVLLEAGPLIEPHDFIQEVWATMQRVYWDSSLLTAFGNSVIPVQSGRLLGGTTAINAAICFRLPESVREEWRQEHGCELFTEEGARAAAERVEDTMRIAPTPNAQLTLPDRAMIAAACKVGMHGLPIRRNVSGCNGCSACWAGCHSHARKGTDQTYVPRALRAGAGIYTCAHVDRVLGPVDRAEGVEGRFFDPLSSRRGPRFRVTARATVIAAGTIRTPYLLLATGHGNRYGQVGRHFTNHPATGVTARLREPTHLLQGVHQGMEVSDFNASEGITLESISLPPEVLAVRIPGIGRPFVERVQRYDRFATLGVMLRARTTGRVTRGPFGRPFIRYSVTNDDAAALGKGLQRVVELLFDAGAEEVYPGVHGVPKVLLERSEARVIGAPARGVRRANEMSLIANHPMSSCRMGKDPASSVVGPEGETHATRDLWISDASVFPNAPGVNPQVTVMTVSELISARLVQRLGGRAPAGVRADA